MMTQRRVLMLAGITGALGILVGAFGAHGLPKILEPQVLSVTALQEREAWLETGVRYHMFHTLALLALALGQVWSKRLAAAAFCWLVGIMIFSGLLYAMAFTGIRVLGAIVPLGGLAFIVGWVLVAVTKKDSHSGQSSP